MQLTDLQIPIATRLHLTIANPDQNSQTFAAQLLGYRCDHSVIGFLPKRPPFPLRQNVKIEVRLGLQSAIVRFASTLMLVCEQPYLYVHLDYPAEVVIEKQLRQALRFPFDAPATCMAHGTELSIIPCTFVDISLSGARLAFNEKLPTTTSRICLSLCVKIANADQKLELDVIVKSQPEENAEAPFFYGVTFTDKSVQQQLLLEAMCFELQVRKA